MLLILQRRAGHLLTPSSTGYGQHADYVFGWKGDALQQAMDNQCFGATCSKLTSQSLAKKNKCVVKNTVVGEETEGCKLSLSLFPL